MQVVPIEIARFDRLQLPGVSPRLDLLLALGGGLHGFVQCIPYQRVQPGAAGEAFDWPNAYIRLARSEVTPAYSVPRGLLACR